jgi:hypothetical protein
VVISLLKRDLELEDFAVVHRAVAVRHLVECGRTVEDTAGLDPSLQDVWQERFDVSAHRRGAAGHAGVLPKRDAGRRRVVLRYADATDRTAGTGDFKGCDYRLFKADAFEHGVGAEATGQLADALDGAFAALTDDVGGAELLP